jgi:hypothetical protein
VTTKCKCCGASPAIVGIHHNRSCMMHTTNAAQYKKLLLLNDKQEQEFNTVMEDVALAIREQENSRALRKRLLIQQVDILQVTIALEEVANNVSMNASELRREFILGTRKILEILEEG